MIIKKYEIFRESNDSGITIGTMTNMGKVIWMDNPYKNTDGTDADISVKTDKPNKENNQSFTWNRLSDLTKVEEVKPETSVDGVEDVKEKAADALKSEIQFDDLMKIDIRVCNVISAEKIKGKDRLLVLKVNTGFDERTIVTNLGSNFTPEELTGKNFGFVLNLKPARIGGIQSSGMIIAASDSSGKPYLVETSALAGSKII